MRCDCRDGGSVRPVREGARHRWERARGDELDRDARADGTGLVRVEGLLRHRGGCESVALLCYGFTRTLVPCLGRSAASADPRQAVAATRCSGGMPMHRLTTMVAIATAQATPCSGMRWSLISNRDTPIKRLAGAADVLLAVISLTWYGVLVVTWLSPTWHAEASQARSAQTRLRLQRCRASSDLIRNVSAAAVAAEGGPAASSESLLATICGADAQCIIQLAQQFLELQDNDRSATGLGRRRRNICQLIRVDFARPRTSHSLARLAGIYV